MSATTISGPPTAADNAEHCSEANLVRIRDALEALP